MCRIVAQVRLSVTVDEALIAKCRIDSRTLGTTIEASRGTLSPTTHEQNRRYLFSRAGSSLKTPSSKPYGHKKEQLAAVFRDAPARL